MKLAILFWFYRDIDVCKNRLEILRALNNGIPIFGLWGGSPDQAEDVRSNFDGLLDDFYSFAATQDNGWKWKNGDLMIADWFAQRGRHLQWDTIIVVQWDMLILAAIRSVFGMLKHDEMLLSGFRPASEVTQWWPWLNPENTDLQQFVTLLKSDFNYLGPLWCCLFIVACLPRLFLMKYTEAGPPKEGFLEYKVPTMAKIFGLTFCQNHPFQPWWAADPSTRRASAGQRILNAVGQEVSLDTVLYEASVNGARVFHPYRKIFPVEIALNVEKRSPVL